MTEPRGNAPQNPSFVFGCVHALPRWNKCDLATTPLCDEQRDQADAVTIDLSRHNARPVERQFTIYIGNSTNE